MLQSHCRHYSTSPSLAIPYSPSQFHTQVYRFMLSLGLLSYFLGVLLVNIYLHNKQIPSQPIPRNYQEIPRQWRLRCYRNKQVALLPGEEVTEEALGGVSWRAGSGRLKMVGCDGTVLWFWLGWVRVWGGSGGRSADGSRMDSFCKGYLRFPRSYKGGGVGGEWGEEV